MCIEKTPWEQVIDFHGHTCPEIALGFRIAQIASRELGIRPSTQSQLLAEVNINSCALDAIQILNHCTIGRGTLIVKDLGKHVYKFHYTGTSSIVRIVIQPEILNLLTQIYETENPRLRQNKSLEAIQHILTVTEDNFCVITHKTEEIARRPSDVTWIICSSCGDPVLKSTLTEGQNGTFVCLECKS